jgi:hypothetical protein
MENRRAFIQFKTASSRSDLAGSGWANEPHVFVGEQRRQDERVLVLGFAWHPHNQTVGVGIEKKSSCGIPTQHLPTPGPQPEVPRMRALASRS